MKRCTKLLSVLVLVLVMCFAVSSLASAAEAIPESSSLINGGLEAEILTEAEENGVLPVTVKITNTNDYDVSGIRYKLTATENGKLFGNTSDSNLTIVGGDSFTSPSSSLKAVPAGAIPQDNNNLYYMLWVILSAIALAITAFLATTGSFQQTVSMLLVILEVVGVVAVGGVPASGVPANPAESEISFTVSEDVTLGGKTIGLTLEVTLPDLSGDDKHTVTFVDSDNNTVKSFIVPDGESLNATDIPILTKTGKAFFGWSLNSTGTEPFYSDDPVTNDLTVFPIYGELETDKYNVPVFFDAGIVQQAHSFAIQSEREITSANLTEFATLEARFGDAPAITVTPLGDNKYELSGIYPKTGTFCWKLTDDAASFDGLDAGVREYGFSVIGEETEEYEQSDELRDIENVDFIALEATADDYASFLNVFGSSYAVGDKLGIPNEEGSKTYYKVTEVLNNTVEPSSGKTNWRLKVTPCAIEEVYDEIDVNQYNREADEIIDISNPEDIENYVTQIENSEQMRVYADYLASAINDSEEFQKLIEESYGTPAYIGYQSDTMRAARGGSSTENTADAIDEALELVGGIEVNRPGVNVSISASVPTIKLDDFNSYWDERYSEVGEIDPKTGNRVNVGKTDFFGKKFASIKTDVSIAFSLNGGTKNITVEAKLQMKQSVKMCSATQVKLEVGWEIYSGSKIHAGATAYTETSVDYTVTLKTDNGGFDITEEIDDIISAANGEKYESDNRYIRRFRNLYDGSERDFIEVYRKDFCQFKFCVGPVELNIPIAFVVRFGLSAGVGIGYDYRTTYTVGVYKEKNSTKIEPYYSSGEPDWDFDFYVAGHAGVKIALNAQLGITITGCSKIFEIGLEAELGLRADFYGYFLLSIEKTWDSSATTVDTGGAYYFNTKVYFDLKLFAKAFVFENKWDLYSWEYTLFTSGNRYVLLDFERQNAVQTEPIIIPVTKDSKFTTVVDAGLTYETVAFSLEPYFDALDPVFFDLQKSNEVFSSEETDALLNQYTTVTSGGGLTLPRGAASVTGPVQVHLRPYARDRLLNNEIFEANAYVTIVYNGPVFSFGDERPSITLNFKLVSEKYLTGEKYNVNYWVDGELYQTKQYIEGMSISPWDAYVDDDYIASLGLEYAKFSIPAGNISGDMDLHARVRYSPNNTVKFYSKLFTSNGIDDNSDTYYSYTMRKNDDVSTIRHPLGVLQPYFIGWDLVGDGSDELNVPISGQNSTYSYEAVYGEMPVYTVTTVDGASGTVLSEEDVTLGESYTIDAASPPDDGREYISTVTRESGTYTSPSRVLEVDSVIYPVSDLTLVWNHKAREYTVYVYSDNDGTLIDTQLVEHGNYFTDPVGEENWASLDYHADNGSYYKFIGWEVWDGTEFVDATTFGITNHCAIFPVRQYLGVKHNITLLDEDNETVLFSGLINNGMPLNNGYYATKLSDKEKNYEICWKSAEDGSVTVNATESGTYILDWKETAREYTISLDDESDALDTVGIVFEDGIPYGSLESYIADAIGSFVPVKPETDFCTYTYDGFTIYCTANPNGEYGICTVSFNFEAVQKECAVSFDVNGADDNTGTLWHNERQMTLQNGVYGFEFTLDEENSEILLNYEVTPDDRNYSFAGWSFNGSVYDVGDSVSLVGVDTAVFTAVYELKPYAVTFNADGGVLDGDDTVYANADEIITLPTPAKASDAQYTYSFSNWKNDAGDVFTGSYQVSGFVTLTAEYTKTLRSYYITFNANGGVFEGDTTSISLLTDYGVIPTPEIPTRASTLTKKYTFAAWTPVVSPVSGTAEYTATWSETNLYTLTFDAGYGSFGANTSQKTYVLEQGESFNLSTVPVPYYSYDGEVKKFVNWTPNVESVTVTENASFTATWSEPVSTTGILISDGINTEDIAASLAGAQLVEGYSLEYLQVEEGSEPFFVLSITGDGLTLSGSGTVEYTDIHGVSLTLNDLTISGNITAYGPTAVTVDGTVSISTDNDCAISLTSMLDAPEGTPEGSLSFTGADQDAKLIVNSTGGASGISSFDGNLSVNGLNLEITANEMLYEGDEDVHIPVALGSIDSAFSITINNSTVLIHKGYLSGLTTITNSTVEFDGNDYNGFICYFIDYTDTPVMPDNLISLDNSSVVFNGKAYIAVSYSQYNSDVYFYFCKDDGVDEYGGTLAGWFTTNQMLNDELNSSDAAWLIDIGEGSSIQISE